MHFLPAKGRVMYFRKLSRFAGVSEAGARRACPELAEGRNPEREARRIPNVYPMSSLKVSRYSLTATIN